MRKPSMLELIITATLNLFTVVKAASISGYVKTCDRDANPIAGASVKIYNNSDIFSDTFQTTTDANGYYFISETSVVDTEEVNTKNMDVDVINVLGQIVEKHNNINANRFVWQNKGYASAIYFFRFSDHKTKPHVKKIFIDDHTTSVNFANRIPNKLVINSHKISDVQNSIYTIEISSPNYEKIVHDSLSVSGNTTFNVVLPAKIQYTPQGEPVNFNVNEFKETYELGREHGRRPDILSWNPLDSVRNVYIDPALDTVRIANALGDLRGNNPPEGSIEQRQPYFNFVRVDTINWQTDHGIEIIVGDGNSVPEWEFENGYIRYILITLEPTMPPRHTIQHEVKHGEGRVHCGFQSIMSISWYWMGITNLDIIYEATALSWKYNQLNGNNNAVAADLQENNF
ncbi:MAG: carboxypeptidase-like regulatory domain-containing protein [Candidatus Woesearchaeota archaeon]